ncbi:MAG: SDR family oxidoreductase [Chloroflexi bacterium]|nr:SDR family oxidoreductase [Chloroflexota bacterium]
MGGDLLKGRVAIVSGASKGVGQGIALSLAEAGASVAVNYHRDAAGAQETVTMIERLGVEAIAVPADVADRYAVEEMVARTTERFETVDIVVANAGVTIWQDFLSMNDATWATTIDTNLRGTFLLCQAAARWMVARQRPGRLITMGSGAAKVAFPGAAAYNASKGGIALLTQAMAVELGPYGITVNCVAPGAIEIARTRLEDPHYAKTWGAVTPLQRVGVPEDVGRVCVWLASEAAEFVTGQVIWVDGGLFVQGPWPRERYGLETDR